MQYLSNLLSQFAPLLLSALATYLVAVAERFLSAHLKVKNAQAQQLVSELLTTVILRGSAFVNSEVQTNLVPRIAKASTGNEKVDKIIDYAAVQSPALLKTAGIDITSTTGQQQLARRIVATLPPPAAEIA